MRPNSSTLSNMKKITCLFPLLLCLPASSLLACNLAVCATSTFTVTIPDDQIPMYMGSGTLPPSNQIDFGSVPSDIPPDTSKPFPLTIGTFNPMDTLTITATNNWGGDPSDNTHFYMSVAGTQNKLAYTMQYTPCAGSQGPFYFRDAVGVPLNNGGALMADTTANAAPCRPYPQGGGTPGNGAGNLIFTLVPGEVAAAGAYTDTVTLTVTN